MTTTAHTATLLDDLLRSRSSCRAFTPVQVPHSEIEAIIETSSRTPSWCNTQPWHLHVTEGASTERLRLALREHIAEGPLENPDIPFPAAYEGAYADRRRASGWQLYESLGIEKGDRAASGRQMLRNFDFFDAPHVAIVTTERALGTYGAVDCGLFVNSFLLAAHSRGIATIPQAAIASQAPLLRAHLGLPENREVLLAIAFGYADSDHPANAFRTDRQDPAAMTTWLSQA